MCNQDNRKRVGIHSLRVGPLIPTDCRNGFPDKSDQQKKLPCKMQQRCIISPLREERLGSFLLLPNSLLIPRMRPELKQVAFRHNAL